MTMHFMRLEIGDSLISNLQSLVKNQKLIGNGPLGDQDKRNVDLSVVSGVTD